MRVVERRRDAPTSAPALAVSSGRIEASELLSRAPLWAPACASLRSMLWALLAAFAAERGLSLLELDLQCCSAAVADHQPLVVLSGLLILYRRVLE